MRYAALFVVVALIGFEFAPAQQSVLSRAEQEEFLLKGVILSRRPIGIGITKSVRVELSYEGIEHSAHLQTVDLERTTGRAATDFRDSYRSNVAAYRLDQLLGQDLVPTSVIREIDGQPAALTWWVDDTAMMKKERYLKQITPPDIAAWSDQMLQAEFFNNLVYSTDPNLGNLVIDTRWRLWALDFTRAFQGRADIRRPASLERIDAGVYEKLKSLTRPELTSSLQELIGGLGVAALVVRRDKIVALFEARIAEVGRQRVLFDLQAQRRLLATPRQLARVK